nr:serine/threonine-protein kinase HT1 [Tanacetum cinerariifolium]
MMTDKDSSAAGTDNRHPMLEENDYESWRIRIERYIKGKPHGKLIWKSIQNGPTPHPQTTDPAPEGDAVPPPRNKRDKEFTEEDNKNELVDIHAINILSQGLLRPLFDESERFRANGNELIQDYFVCFHKLVNDMKVTQLDIPTHQLNTKFANNLPSDRGKYVTHTKNNMNMSTITYVELFTHLRTYEEHALKSLKKKEQSSVVVDPLAYLAKTTPTHSTTSHVTVPTLQSSGDSHNDAMLATINQIANWLSGLQKQFPPTNNQLRTSSNPKTHATVHDGQIVTETVQRRAPSNTGTKGIQTTGSGVNNSGKKVICYNGRGKGHVVRHCKEPKPTRDSQWYHDKALLMQAKEKRAVLDAKAEAFLADVVCTAPYDQPLALTTTNLFEANHEDAYDSDVDEGPHASVDFMANLSSIGGTNGSSSSHINEKMAALVGGGANLSFLHSKKIVQCDVKTKNVSLDANGTLKIADFGVVHVEAQNPKDMTGKTGTLTYMAPEVIDGKPYDRKCDNLRTSISKCCPSSLANIMKKSTQEKAAECCLKTKPQVVVSSSNVLVVLEFKR